MMALRTLLVCILCCLGFSARVYDTRLEEKLHQVPDEVVEELVGLLRKKKYRYIVIETSDFAHVSGDRDKNYADFKQQMLACKGVCISFYDFAWKAPRGGGFVSEDEPAMFTWAPDQKPEGLQTMQYMKLKMGMPGVISQLKKASEYTGALIQCNRPSDLEPSHLITKLKGGRLGNRVDNLNDSGKALVKQLNEELSGGASDDSAPMPEKPDIPAPTPPKPKPKPAPALPEPAPVQPTPAKPPAPSGGASVAVDMDEIERTIEEKVDAAVGAKETELISKAEAAAVAVVGAESDSRVKEVAQQAAKEAVRDAFVASAEHLQ